MYVLLLPAYSLYLKEVKYDEANGVYHAVGTPRSREAMKFRYRSDAQKFRDHYAGSGAGMDQYQPWRCD